MGQCLWWQWFLDLQIYNRFSSSVVFLFINYANTTALFINQISQRGEFHIILSNKICLIQLKHISTRTGWTTIKLSIQRIWYECMYVCMYIYNLFFFYTGYPPHANPSSIVGLKWAASSLLTLLNATTEFELKTLVKLEESRTISSKCSWVIINHTILVLIFSVITLNPLSQYFPCLPFLFIKQE